MKRLVVVCDGTWQTLIQRTPTNVARFAQVIESRDQKGDEQIVYYDSGVGTPFTMNDQTWWSRLKSMLRRTKEGAFGGGLEEKIYDAYRFLAMNYAPGDKIFLFGFSRGAFTVRSLAGLIYNSGLLHRQNLFALEHAYRLYRDPDLRPSSWTCTQFRKQHSREVDIDFLGCWDTVGMLGVPDLIGKIDFDDWVNARYTFHDTQLNRRILNARHACAIDERREAFPVTPMTPSPSRGPAQVKERWFIGGHGSIGGGEAWSQPLADFALTWMAEQARASRLAINAALLEQRTAPDPFVKLRDPTGWLARLGFKDREMDSGATVEDLDPSVIVRWKRDPEYRPGTLGPLKGAIDGAPDPDSA